MSSDAQRTLLSSVGVFFFVIILLWFTEFGHLDSGDMLTSEQLRCMACILTGKRRTYLTVILELFAGKPVSWAMSFSPDCRLTMKAPVMAWKTCGKPSGVMRYSYQGSHYTSRQFRLLLWQYRIRQNRSQRGSCCDNSPMECFFRNLKNE